MDTTNDMQINRKVLIRQEREELEKQVANLQKKLKNEEIVRELFENALHPNTDKTTLIIPIFLPKTKKELIEEVVMVEMEIARLEKEISKIKTQNLKEISNSYMSKIEQPLATNHALNKLPLEKGPMFFINQAINGNYNLYGFTSNNTGENKGIQRKNGEKQYSPRPPKNLSPKQSDANKLSEKLMKCMICIFLRLIRTSKTSEIERSRYVSRSQTFPSKSRSFQLKNGTNMNTSISLQKDSAQQDPYGIFDIEDSIVRDIGPYKNLVKCTSTSFSSKNILSSLQLSVKLRELMEELRKVDLRFMTHHQKLAFWINIYNACIMHSFVEHGLPTSPEKITALKNKAAINVGGNKLTALYIEHFILKQSNEDYPDNDSEEQYGLMHSEPNVVFALCSGNRSSPSLRIYTADGVSNELEKSKLEYLQASIVVTTTKRLMVPKLLESNLHNFATDLSSLMEWICNQLPTSGSLKKSMLECLKCAGDDNISRMVDAMPCDYEFQYLLPLN